MKLLLSQVVFILLIVLNGSGFGQEQEYKVGDSITLMRGGKVIETTITGIDGIWIKFMEVLPNGTEVEMRTTAAELESAKRRQSRMGNAGGPQGPAGPPVPGQVRSTDSRTAIGFNSSNGQMTFVIRPWQKKSGEEFRARLKELVESGPLTLIDPDGEEFQVELDELDEIDINYLQRLAVQIQTVMSGGRRGSGRRGMGGNSEPAKRETEAPVMRKWKSGNGQFSIDAIFVSSDGSKVKLKKEDGGEIDVEIAALSDSDQKYISERAPAAGTNFVNFSGSKPFQNMPGGSAFSPDAIRPLELKEVVSVPIPDRGLGGSKPDKLLMTDDGKMAMVVVSSGTFNNRNTRLEIIDLKQKKLTGFFQFPSTTETPIGIGSDNKKLFSLTEQDGLMSECRLDRWSLVDGKIVPGGGVILFADDDAGGFGGPGRGGMNRGGGLARQSSFDNNLNRPHSSGVVNDNTVFIQTMTNLSFIDVPTGKVLYADRIQGFDPPAISPNRKYLAFHPAGSGKILVIDCKELKLVQTIPVDVVNHLDFSDDGTKLACVSNGSSIQIHDIATGNLLEEYFVPFDGTSLFWSGNEHIVVGFFDEGGSPGYEIIDAVEGFPIADWKPMTQYGLGFRRLGRGNFLFASDGFDGFVGSLQIPPAEWIKKDIDVNKFYVRIKGNEVAIDVSAPGFDGITRRGIEDLLAKQIQDAGGTVGSNGRMKIIGSKRVGPTENRQYKERESDKMQTISITPCINELVILFDGKEVLRSEAPTVTTLSSGTMAEIQASANQAANPDPSFFATSKIPKSIPLKDVWKTVPSYQTN